MGSENVSCPRNGGRAANGCGGDVVFSVTMRVEKRVRGFSGKLRRVAGFVALALCLAGLAAPVFAWNDEGTWRWPTWPTNGCGRNAVTSKRVTQAESVLCQVARRRFRRTHPTADADRMIFMIAATWPDQIRSDPQYVDDGPIAGTRRMGRIRRATSAMPTIFGTNTGTSSTPLFAGRDAVATRTDSKRRDANRKPFARR